MYNLNWEKQMKTRQPQKMKLACEDSYVIPIAILLNVHCTLEHLGSFASLGFRNLSIILIVHCKTTWGSLVSY